MKLEEQIKQCGYADDKERTDNLVLTERSLSWARGLSSYEFCQDCKGYNTKCQYYYTG